MASQKKLEAKVDALEKQVAELREVVESLKLAVAAAKKIPVPQSPPHPWGREPFPAAPPHVEPYAAPKRQPWELPRVWCAHQITPHREGTLTING